MKRLLLGVFATLFLMTGTNVTHAGVNDFSISRYDITYELSKDGDGRSTLRTVEMVTAQFPNYDQNHGLERAIPTTYDGHSTSLNIESITKSDGSDWDYSTSKSGDNEIIRIGDADKYVKGEQTFILTYTQHDVTKTFSNTKSDEFYWDTNGTDWKVPIERLNVTLKIDDSIASSMTGNNACYQGTSGSNSSCDLRQTDDGLTTFVTNLGPGQNVTIASGFKTGTFANYQKSFFERLKELWHMVILATFVIAFIILFIVLYLWNKWSNRTSEKGTIIPEYLPPTDTSVTTAASIFASPKAILTAQLLDFAVRHYVKVIQTREKSFWRAAEYDIEIIQDTSTLKAEEKELLSDLFDGPTVVGMKLSLKTLQNNTSLYNRTRDNDKKLKDLIENEYGLRAKDPVASGKLKTAGYVLLAAAVVTFSPALLVVAVITIVLGLTIRPLTDKGLALSRYLDGLKEYINVAETERIRMLQSPDGAAKVGNVDANDSSQRLKLYERVLPYAVLFGQEKEWAKRIGDIYESNGTSPGWYSGNSAAFNAVAFSSAMNGFSTAASYSSSSSSSSGGSSGGGSSGGGGGGGGGGGW